MPIHSDPNTYNLLFNDINSADDIWKPGSYWTGYVKRNKSVLDHLGSLDNFRNEDLKGFAASSPASQLKNKRLIFLVYLLSKLPIINKISNILTKELQDIRNSYSEYITRLQYMQYYYIKSMDEENLLDSLEDSGLGNPRDLFTINNKQYTFNFLRKLQHLIFVKRSLKFNEINTIIEIGGGYGAQAEVILKYKPTVKYILIDIPPQIYITECYLKSIFPNKVLGYKDTRNLNSLNLKEFEDYNIFILAPWQIKICSKVDLAWNCASFQEMTSEKVENYLKYLTALSDYIYICTLEKGHVQLPELTSSFFINRLKSKYDILENSLATDIIGNDSNNKYINLLFKSK